MRRLGLDGGRQREARGTPGAITTSDREAGDEMMHATRTLWRLFAARGSGMGVHGHWILVGGAKAWHGEAGKHGRAAGEELRLPLPLPPSIGSGTDSTDQSPQPARRQFKSAQSFASVGA